MDVEDSRDGTNSVISPGYVEQLAQYEVGIIDTESRIKVRCQNEMFD